MKILVLELDNNYKMIRNTNECDYYNYFKYPDSNIIQKILKKSTLPIAKNFFGKWITNIKNYDMVILFDRGFNKLISKYIKKTNPKCKIILWLWNPVSDKHLRFMKDKNIDEIWTYDINDSQKYNLKFNTQFYNKELVKKNETHKEFDVMFIGNNKGRDRIIQQYELIFKEKNINAFIKIINNYKDNISYDEYLEQLHKSNAILDIVNNDVSGITLRSLESIFYKKKLITNNKYIKNYDFYNPNNIFILNEDDINTIDIFLKSEYKNIENNIIEFYDSENWLNRFYKGEI